MKKPICLLGMASLLCADDYSLNNHWFLTGEFVYLRRMEIHSHGIVNDSNKTICASDACPSYHVLTTGKLVDEFSFEPGYRVGIRYMPNKQWSMEVMYLWVDEWHSEATRHGNGSLTFPLDNSTFSNDFNNANVAHASYDSRMNTTEGNWWWHITPRRVDYFSFSWLLGARYFYIKEKFHLSMTGVTDKSDYKITTWNQLGGIQGGANFQMNPVRRWSFDATLKLGILADFAANHVFMGDFNNTVTLRHSHTRRLVTHPIFMIDLPVSLTYQIWTHLSLHAGYEFLYLDGVLLAPEQIDKGVFPNHHRWYAKGDPIYQGFFTGMTLGF